jgi:hypothetical protein
LGLAFHPAGRFEEAVFQFEQSDRARGG